MYTSHFWLFMQCYLTILHNYNILFILPKKGGLPMQNEMALLLGGLLGLALCLRASLAKTTKFRPRVRKIFMTLTELAIVVLVAIIISVLL